MDPNDVTLEYIDSLQDLLEAFDLAESLGVDLEGLNTIEEIQERLRCFLKKYKPGFVNYKDKICQAMKVSKRDDDNKRSQLLEVLEKTCQKLTSDGDGGVSIIEESLRTEGLVTELQHDFQLRQNSMKKGNCCFVVAGETSAGKSLFLNLWLGKDLLPSCLPPCTSVITRLSFDTKQHARVVYHDASRPHDVYENFVYEDLDHILSEKNYEKREILSDIKEVQIYLPSKILESGLVLIDTPGIGENEDMDKVIETFVDNNEVMGFIYIIKSNNGGGVDEDRLIRLMKIILQKQNSKSDQSGWRFNPSCAMFICNQWDLLTEQDKVYSHITDRLGKIWPNYTEEKTLQFSAFNAKRETNIDVDFITEEYEKMLNLLLAVYNEAMNERIKVTFKWIKTVILRTVHHLKTIVRQLNRNDYQLQDSMKEAQTKLDELKNKSAHVILFLREKIKETSQKITAEFREYLKLPVVRMAITQWIDDELPSPYKPDSTKREWTDLKMEIDSIIVDRIGCEFEKWEEENGTIATLKYEVNATVRGELQGLNLEFKEIENKLDSSNGSTDDEDQTKSKRYDYSPRKSIASQYFQKINFDATRFNLNSVAYNKLTKPFKSILKPIFPSTNRWKAYADDKRLYARSRSEKLLKRFTERIKNEEDPLEKIIECFMEDTKENLEKLTEKIPNAIRANEDILRHVLSCKQESITNKRMYEEKMKDLEIFKRLLANYGAGYIFVDDFKADELQILDPNDISGRSTKSFKISEFLVNMASSQVNYKMKQCSRALWTAHEKGLLSRHNTKEPVSIKVYLPSCKMDKCYPEVAKLRLLEHEYVAIFLGIQHSDSHLPAMVYKNHLRTLKRHFARKCSESHIDIQTLLFEVALGLEYIHANGMVHMELSRNSIMVDKYGSIRLTGSCLPRKADLPEDSENHVCGELTYLAPEVLRGDLYVSSADVYSYGLLLFELLTGIQAFRNQRKMSLDLFTKNVNPKSMMNYNETLKQLSNPTHCLIKNCTEQQEGLRQQVSELLTELPKLKVESWPDVHTLNLLDQQLTQDQDEFFGTRF